MLKIIKRDWINAQWAQSRNLNENYTQRIKRIFWILVYFLKAIWISLLRMNQESLGEKVLYKGRICVISNWAGSELPTLAAQDFYEQNCSRKEIGRLKGIRNSVGRYWNRFIMYFGWYSAYWSSIDINNKIYTDINRDRN